MKTHSRSLQKLRQAAPFNPSRTHRHFGLLLGIGAAFFAASLGVVADSPSLTCGVLGSAGNLNYQKSATSPLSATVQDGRRVDVESNGIPVGTAYSSGYASADFGSLHLSLLAKATAEGVTDTFWGHGSRAAGNAVLHDIVTPLLPGSPAGTEVLVRVSLEVAATLSDTFSSAYLESTVTLHAADVPAAEVRFSVSGSQSPPSYLALNHQTTPIDLQFGQSSVVVKLKSGTSYMLDAVLQGDASAQADINPGMAPESHVPFSQAMVEASNSAHIGLSGVTPGLQLITASKGTYPPPSSTPSLVASDSATGPFEPVTNAVVAANSREISVPISTNQRFFRFSSGTAMDILSIRIESGQLVLRY